MSLKTLQNFYKQTVSQTWETGTGTRYVSVKPTPSEGWLVVSPSNTSLREIVYYTSTGTDGTGDYVVISQRGLGGTTDQTHAVNEPIRMNFTAQHQQEISDAMDQIVAGGAQDASTSTKGIAKLSVAPASASNPIAVGDNDTRLHPAVDIQNFETSGTWTKPAGAKTVEVTCIGGGGGGGNGLANNVAPGGGSGGGGGALVRQVFSASLLGGTEAVTVPAASGAQTAGGNVTFGAWLKATGGGAGVIGTQSTSVAGGTGGSGMGYGSTNTAGAAGTNAGAGGASGGSSVTNGAGLAGGNGYVLGAGGGGAGGGQGATLHGGAGGTQSARGTAITGGIGGTGTNGGVSTVGGTPSDCTQYEPIPGAGGGGGGGNTSAAAKNGGGGGKYGGGGGGGGSAQVGQTVGTGGSGATGFCQVITYF